VVLGHRAGHAAWHRYCHSHLLDRHRYDVKTAYREIDTALDHFSAAIGLKRAA